MSLPLVHLPPPPPARELPAEVHRRLGANPHHGPGDGNGPALFRGYLDLSGTLSPACSALPPHVALNVLTNDFNKAARVALDFPAVVA